MTLRRFREGEERALAPPRRRIPRLFVGAATVRPRLCVDREIGAAPTAAEKGGAGMTGESVHSLRVRKRGCGWENREIGAPPYW